MDDNHDNSMADIIGSGTNTIATFTDEECIQADMYLNIPPNEEDAAPVEDTTANIEDNSRKNDESLVNKRIKCSHEVCICLCTAVLFYTHRSNHQRTGSTQPARSPDQPTFSSYRPLHTPQAQAASTWSAASDECEACPVTPSRMGCRKAAI
jgi:hypothetical protein